MRLVIPYLEALYNHAERLPSEVTHHEERCMLWRSCADIVERRDRGVIESPCELDLLSKDLTRFGTIALKSLDRDEASEVEIERAPDPTEAPLTDRRGELKALPSTERGLSTVQVIL